MTRQDQIIAVIRTGVPALVGSLLAFVIAHVPFVASAIAWTDAQLSGYGLPGVVLVLQALIVALIVAGYYWLARRVGARWPAVEKWLLGRSATPLYHRPAVTAERTVQIIPGATLRTAAVTDPPHYGS